MFNKNTMPKYEYVTSTVTMALAAIVWHDLLLFKGIASLTYMQSLAVLHVMMALSLVTGFISTWKKRRNLFSMFVNILLPLIAYNVIARMGENSAVLLVAIGMTAVFTALYIMFILGQRIHEGSDKKRILKNRFIYAVKGWRTVATVCFAAALVCIVVPASFSATEPSETVSEEVLKWSMADKAEAMLNLEEDKWKTLSHEEKEELVWTMINIEAGSLHIPHKIDVEIVSLEGNVAACYDDSVHIINIDDVYFDNCTAQSMLNTICHEVYHAYQFRLVDAYRQIDESLRKMEPFDAAGVYAAEFENYISSNEDSSGYENQLCEKDAYDYAKSRTEHNYQFLEVYKKTMFMS